MRQEPLFNIEINEEKNLLPYDGVVSYFGEVFKLNSANFYLLTLLETIEWRQDELIMFGKKISTKRKVSFYGDKGIQYTYSKTTKAALPWTKELLKIRSIIEEKTGSIFNACLLNLYHDGSEGMGWHSDDEKELKTNGTIASLSFGAERKFVFKHKKSQEKISLALEHGSLLVMKETTQKHWLHQLPPSKKITSPRVNLTFRMISVKD